MTEFHLFLPQMRMDFPTLVERAQAAEAAGFDGLALMDHLSAPMADHQPVHEAMVTATWLAAHTSRLTLGHLVLCDGFRHPAVLAKAAVSLDHASNGRFEVGLGWGSYDAEFERFGLGPLQPSHRFGRMAESVEIMTQLWRGETFDHKGDHRQLDEAMQAPTPTRPLPLVIGGAGPRTLALAAHHATWWNCPTYALPRFGELRQKVGDARPSLQVMISLVPDEASRPEVTALTERRFGQDRPDIVLGTAPEVAERLARWMDDGVERFYPWFCDFAVPETLEAFGAEVISALR